MGMTNNGTVEINRKEDDKYVIFIGDEFTVKYKALGYYYNAEDVRLPNSMPLVFDNEREAIQKYIDILSLVIKYADKITAHSNRGKAIEEVKKELEKITSNNYSIIMDLIRDLIDNNWMYDVKNRHLTFLELRICKYKEVERLRREYRYILKQQQEQEEVGE